MILRDRNLPDLEEGSKRIGHIVNSRKPPVEPSDARQKRKQLENEIKEKFPFVDEGSTQEEQTLYNSKVASLSKNTLSKRLYQWKPLTMDDKTSYYYLFGRTAAEYAALRRVFHEILVRDRLFSPKSVFDFGSGVGTVSWLSHEFWGKSLKEYFTVDISSEMNNLARLILQNNNENKEPYLKTLYQRQFLPATPRAYDLVVSAYSLMDIDSLKSRLDIVRNLWSKTKDYLIIVEKGSNAGYQIVEEARAYIIQMSQQSPELCHVFAPCPHEEPCPRLRDESGTPCNFSVKYFPITIEEKHQEPQTELFSYLIVKKGKRDVNSENWPRIVRQVLHRHKHVICRLCVPSGNLEEIILTAAKHGKDVYKCGKKCSWGDNLPVSVENHREKEEVVPDDQSPTDR